MIQKFTLQDESGFRAWLDATPKAVVFWRGVGCEYSARFAPHYAQLDGEGAALAQRAAEHGAEGPVGDRYELDLTPTLVCYRHGKESARLEAAIGVGIRPDGALAWVRGLGP